MKHVSEYQVLKKSMQQEMLFRIFKTEYQKSRLYVLVISDFV